MQLAVKFMFFQDPALPTLMTALWVEASQYNKHAPAPACPRFTLAEEPRTTHFATWKGLTTLDRMLSRLNGYVLGLVTEKLVLYLSRKLRRANKPWICNDDKDYDNDTCFFYMFVRLARDSQPVTTYAQRAVGPKTSLMQRPSLPNQPLEAWLS